jgi:uncharacterized protein YjbI with pentapeptide repeats
MREVKSNPKVLITSPRLASEKDAVTPDRFEFESDGDYTNLLIRDLDLTGKAIDDSIFDSVRFVKIGLNNTSLKKCQFRDARLDTCNLANAEWKACKLAQIHWLQTYRCSVSKCFARELRGQICADEWLGIQKSGF